MNIVSGNRVLRSRTGKQFKEEHFSQNLLTQKFSTNCFSPNFIVFNESTLIFKFLNVLIKEKMSESKNKTGKLTELESRLKSSRPRRDIDVAKTRLLAKSRDDTET